MSKRAAAKNAADCEVLSFEEALRRLEEIVSQLERGDAPLDSALQLYEEGVRLSRFCSRQLKEAERRVELLEDKNGELTGRPFGAPGRPAAEDGGPETDETGENGDEDHDEANCEDGDEDEEGESKNDQAGARAGGGRRAERKSQDTLF